MVFSLQDGDSGVQELDWWLMNINVSVLSLLCHIYTCDSLSKNQQWSAHKLIDTLIDAVV